MEKHRHRGDSWPALLQKAGKEALPGVNRHTAGLAKRRAHTHAESVVYLGKCIQTPSLQLPTALALALSCMTWAISESHPAKKSAPLMRPG